MTTTSMLRKPRRTLSHALELYASEATPNGAYLHTIANVGDYMSAFSDSPAASDLLLARWRDTFPQQVAAAAMQFLSVFSDRDLQLVDVTTRAVVQDGGLGAAFALHGATLDRNDFNSHAAHELLLADSPREAAIASLFAREEAVVAQELGFSSADLAALNKTLDAGTSVLLDVSFGPL